MQNCPIELLQPILSIACKSDGGSTGRALSEVSSYIRAVSAPYKYHALALHGSQVIIRFHARLKSLNQTSKNSNEHRTFNEKMPKVVALFVSNDGGYQFAYDGLPPGNNYLDFPQGSNRGSDKYARKQDLIRDKALIRSLVPILRTIGPTLQILTICFESRWSTLPFHQFPLMPALIDLTLSYSAPEDGGFHQSIMFRYHFSIPSLKRLDISGLNFDIYLDNRDLYNLLHTFAPSLTHLCLPAEAAANDRQPWLLWLATRNQSDDRFSQLFEKLQIICIELNRGSDCYFCDHSHWHEFWFTRVKDICLCSRQLDLDDLRAKDRRVVFLNAPSEEHDKRSRRVLLMEWMVRVLGEDGVWNGHDQMVFRRGTDHKFQFKS